MSVAFRTVTVGPVWTLWETQPGPWGSGQPGRKAATAWGMVPERPAWPHRGSSLTLALPRPSGWDDTPWLRPLPDTWGTHAVLAGRSCWDQPRTYRGVLDMWPIARGPRGRALGAAQGVPPAPTPSAVPAPPGRAGGAECWCPPLSPRHLRKWLHLACCRRAAWLTGARRPSRPGSPRQPRGGGPGGAGIGWQPLRPLPAAQLPDGPPGRDSARCSQAGGRWGRPGGAGRNSGPWLFPCCLAAVARTERLLAGSPAPWEAVATL